MREDYSLDRFRAAPQEGLSSEDTARLHDFRESQARWRDAVNANNPGLIGTALDLLNSFREAFRLGQIRYDKHEHDVLERAHSTTREGQFEQAHEEASFFNDAYDIRKARLDAALRTYNQNPEEYRAALASFNELVTDLNEGDLKKYEASIYGSRLDKTLFGPAAPSDLSPDTEEDKEELRDFKRYKDGATDDEQKAA